MIIQRITVCLLALTMCLQTPMSVAAADEISGTTQQAALQEGTGIEGTDIEGTDIEETVIEDTVIEDTVIEETVIEETIIEGTLTEGTDTEDAEDTAEEMTDASEQKDREPADAEESEPEESPSVTEPSEEGTDVIIEDVTGPEREPEPEKEAIRDNGTGKELSKDDGADLTDVVETEAVTTVEQNTAAGAVQQTKWTVTGWHKVGYLTFYVKQDYTLARGVTKIGKVKYIFDQFTGELRTGLVMISGAAYLADNNGKMLTGWHTVNKKRYYFTDKNCSDYKEKDEGKRKSGFVYVKGHRYYLMNDKMKNYKAVNFAAMAKGWVTVKGYTYYCDPKTGIIATGFQTIDGKRYYFSDTGSRQPYTGWREVNGKRYYFNSDYSVQRGMSTINGYRYYLNSVTGEVMCGWKTINGRKYYFADEKYRSYNKSIRGQRLTGFREIGGKTYYFITSSMAGYNKADYASRATGFKTINGKVYYFGTDGVMVKDWQTIDGHKYHFSEKGVMDNGWTVIDKKTYYFADGKMVKGWKTIDKRLYYFHKDGHKQECGRVVINGNKCAFDINGVCRSKNSTINDVVQYALKWNGKIDYKSSVTNNDPNDERKNELKPGGATDCSWFVFHCLARYGYLSEFVHSYEWGSKPSKYSNGREIGKDLSIAKAGDVICYAYGTPRTSTNSHVSIYIGGGKEIHCANEYGVTISTVTKKDIKTIVRFSN